jgi:hypothetical protein
MDYQMMITPPNYIDLTTLNALEKREASFYFVS